MTRSAIYARARYTTAAVALMAGADPITSIDEPVIGGAAVLTPLGPDAAAAIDRCVCNYLLLAWRLRERTIGYIHIDPKDRHHVQTDEPRPRSRECTP